MCALPSVRRDTASISGAPLEFHILWGERRDGARPDRGRPVPVDQKPPGALGEGLPVLEYPQTPGRLSPATNSFYEAVVNKALTHDGDPELALHMAHAIIKADPRGERIVKDFKKSP